MFKFLLPLDLSVAKVVDGLRSSCGKFFTPIFKVITLCGNMGAIFIACTVIMLFFKKTKKIGAVSLIALFFGFLFTNLILKNLIARMRPFSDTTSEFYTFWKSAGELYASGYSFPSGHTTSAAAFGVSLFINKDKKYSWLFLLIPVVMGFTRIYFVVHYVSDVFFGFVVGTASAVISHYIVQALSKNEKFKKIF